MKRCRNYLLLTLLVFTITVSDAQKLIDYVDSRYNAVNNLEIKGAFCDVVIEPVHSDAVHLKGEIRSLRGSDGYSIKTLKVKDVLKVWIDFPVSMFDNVKGFLTLQVPTDVILNIETVSGDIRISRIGSEGMVLKSVSGNIQASGIGNNATLQNVSGDIDALLVNGDLKTMTVSGDQKISDIKGAFSSHSTSGDFNVQMVEGMVSIGSVSGYMVLEDLLGGAQLQTNSGDIALNNMKGVLALKTISGDINLSKITGIVNTSTTSGNQQGERIMLTGESRFKSISGNIYMDLDNQLDALGFDLRSASGKLLVGNQSLKTNLAVEGLTFSVKGVTTSGNQHFK
jgi:hypothetical protein